MGQTDSKVNPNSLPKYQKKMSQNKLTCETLIELEVNIIGLPVKYLKSKSTFSESSIIICNVFVPI